MGEREKGTPCTPPFKVSLRIASYTIGHVDLTLYIKRLQEFYFDQL